MGLIEAVRRANRPRAPENSTRLRAACTASALVALAACAAEQEISWRATIAAGALIVVGMFFSHATRVAPPAWVKVCSAVGAIASLVWFVRQVDGGALTNVTQVEDPLILLFALVQVVHSFHVPTRRDLIFTLGASAATVAVGAAQAVDAVFGAYVAAWLICTLWALGEVWATTSGGGRSSISQLAGVGLALVITATLAFAILPAPSADLRINLSQAPGTGQPVAHPGALAGDTGAAAELSKPGSSKGPTEVGGYLGFAGSLDTAVRGSLSDTVVMRVRAERPGYWLGETFDRWNGQDWSSSQPATTVAGGTTPIVIPDTSTTTTGGSDLQTFYIIHSTADLIFHDGSAHAVWTASPSLFYSPNGTIVSSLSMGAGAIYTVESSAGQVTGAALGQASGPSLPEAQFDEYTQLPSTYDRVKELTESITAGATTTYAKVEAIIAWMGANTRYSTDIPPLPAGADTVDEFLFGNRTGYCEQISTSLAVMLRTLDIPAREAVGYVPGPYNPITDLYDVQAQDAHAWVQVWFPGYGWQSFDPTASVPLANPSPAATALADLGRAARSVPPLGAVAFLVVIAAAIGFPRYRRLRAQRPRTWAEAVTARMERAGRRAGRPRRHGETVVEYAAALNTALPDRGVDWSELARSVEAAAYGGENLRPTQRKRMLASAGGRRRIGPDG